MDSYRINTKCVQAGYRPGNGEPRKISNIQSTTIKYDTSEYTKKSTPITRAHKHAIR